MRERRHRYLTLLLFLTLVSLVSLVSDKAIMGFYQLNALSLSSLPSFLPAINSTTLIIAISVLLVIIVGLVVVWLLRKKNKNNEGEEILPQIGIQEQAVEHPSQSVDYRLAQYVRDARAAGLSDEIILGKLRETGWPEETIKQAL